MRTALEHMEAAIAEVEQRVTTGEVSREIADELIDRIRALHERLTRLEGKLNERKSERV